MTQDDYVNENEKDLTHLPQDYEIYHITSIRNNKDMLIITMANSCLIYIQQQN